MTDDRDEVVFELSGQLLFAFNCSSNPSLSRPLHSHLIFLPTPHPDKLTLDARTIKMWSPPSSQPKKECPGAARRNHRVWRPFAANGKEGMQMIDGVYYCNCKTPHPHKLSVMQVTSNRNGNQGKWYYSCPAWDPVERGGCGLYAFEDELEAKHRAYEREYKFEPCETSWWIDPTRRPLEGEASSNHLHGSQPGQWDNDGEARWRSHQGGEDEEDDDEDDEDDNYNTAMENSPAPTFTFQPVHQRSGSQPKRYQQMVLVPVPNDGVSISSGTRTVLNGLESFELSSQRSFRSATDSICSTPSRKRKVGLGLGSMPTPSPRSARTPRNSLLIARESGTGSSSKRQRRTESDDLPPTPTTSRTVNRLYTPRVRSIDEEDEYLDEEGEAAVSVNRRLFTPSSQASTLDQASLAQVVEVVLKTLDERDRIRSSQATVEDA
ncbi:hypothetical protein QBC41DRAFT_323334 [Cercophora samala]|uniref:GRF-type domain-containing protein n=1 Tax=Cercophora samala TaxID=330535 RepID=A0AA40DBC1_9PEZI|nr:hypothetical protein QBC41DRAFT_323334 [Cercophora samala]